MPSGSILWLGIVIGELRQPHRVSPRTHWARRYRGGTLCWLGSELWRIGATALSCATIEPTSRRPRLRALSRIPGSLQGDRDPSPLPRSLGRNARSTRKKRRSSGRADFSRAAAVRRRCPLLPDELVWWTTLAHLSDKIHHRYGKARDATNGYWYYKRARPVAIAPIDPVSKLDRRLLNYLRHYGPTRKRRLQQRLWRIPATMFKATLAYLIAEGPVDRPCRRVGVRD